MRFLQHIVNTDQREYIIEQVQKPLAKAIVLYTKRYPEPTHENVLHPNSHILLDWRVEFRRCWVNRPLYEALWKLVIVKYEHSPAYRFMLDWLFMMVRESKDWKPFNPNRQMRNWRGK